MKTCTECQRKQRISFRTKPFLLCLVMLDNVSLQYPVNSIVKLMEIGQRTNEK